MLCTLLILTGLRGPGLIISSAPGCTCTCSADVEHASCHAGQTALAYVTAKTHGLEAEAEPLAEALGDNLPPVDPQAQLMAPPAPILKEDNWPLLTVSKGYFENLAKGAAGAPGPFRSMICQRATPCGVSKPTTAASYRQALSVGSTHKRHRYLDPPVSMQQQVREASCSAASSPLGLAMQQDRLDAAERLRIRRCAWLPYAAAGLFQALSAIGTKVVS